MATTRRVYAATFRDFEKTLDRIAVLKNDRQWEEVIYIVGLSLKEILNINLKELRGIKSMGLEAQLIRENPTYRVSYKKMMLIALLKETGDYAAEKGKSKAAYDWYVKSLHFLLEGILQGALVADYMHLLPSVESLLAVLANSSLPIRTRILLMRNYEQQGCFDRAENELFDAIEQDPKNIKLLKLGVAFYERLKDKDDSILCVGNLPRTEVECGLAEVRERLKSIG